ncbi:hypothetical protein [Butyrivibrio sp. VCD2006]|uniref:hypothetical protein n=1 Tax=Butyrivibrio sp. VCD2006 TaxID=1280664 RepID=UPI00047D5FC2|nr:hypothetical protein [Butyrivibrio sp. VCD2006]
MKTTGSGSVGGPGRKTGAMIIVIMEAFLSFKIMWLLLRDLNIRKNYQGVSAILKYVVLYYKNYPRMIWRKV